MSGLNADKGLFPRKGFLESSLGKRKKERMKPFQIRKLIKQRNENLNDSWSIKSLLENTIYMKCRPTNSGGQTCEFCSCITTVFRQFKPKTSSVVL